jgi:hypothetical protein
MQEKEIREAQKPIFGSIGIVFGGITLVLPVFMGWFTATVSLILGAVALARGENKKVAYVAIILGIIGWVFVVYSCAMVGKAFEEAAKELDNMSNY